MLKLKWLIQMNKIHTANWYAKTQRLNIGKTLKVGDKVVDIEKNKGIVVKIIKGHDIEDHGCIYIWQSERTNYGADNCEHYVEFGWQQHLRIEN